MKKSNLSKKQFKQCVCALLAATMVVSGIPFSSFGKADKAYGAALMGTCVNGTETLKYKMMDDGTLCITSYEGVKTEIELPGVIDGSTVTKLSDRLFVSNNTITKVVIPDTITDMGESTFNGCMNLKEINIPDGVKVLKDSVLYHCVRLENLHMGSGVTRIEDYAIGNCAKLTKIELPEGLEIIGENAFRNCDSLIEVSIPASVTSIGKDAFYGKILEKYNVASGNENYKSVNGVLLTKDGKCLQAYPRGKKDLTYTIPEGVEKIATYAFNLCSNIRDINIPESLSCIEDDAIYKCDSLKSFKTDENNKYFKSPDQVLYSKDGTVLYKYPAKKADSEYSVLDGVQTIKKQAFGNNNYLQEVHFPASVKVIDKEAFEECVGLKKAVLSENLEYISTCMFRNCVNLADVRIPKSVRYIEESAFYRCEELKKIIIPEGVEKVYGGAFSSCKNLEELYVPSSVKEIGYSSDCSKLTRIYGEKGSAAEEFAIEYEIDFVEFVQEEVGVTLESSVDEMNVGDEITLTANATGGFGPYTYSFLLYSVKDKVWYRFNKTFKEENTQTWTAGIAGDRRFYVEVKDSMGSVVRSEAKTIKVNDTAEGPLTVTANVDNANPVVGTSIKIIADAKGGYGSYKYSFLIHNPATKEWYRYGSFKTDSTLIWKVSGTGKRNFYVEVKDETGNVIRSQAATVTIADKNAALAITGKASSSTVAVGSNVTITGTATGGTAPYTYSFLIHNPAKKEWYRYGNGTFKSANTHTWKAAGTGSRNFYIEVKDGTGKVVRSKAVVVNIK